MNFMSGEMKPWSSFFFQNPISYKSLQFWTQLLSYTAEEIEMVFNVGFMQEHVLMW